MTEKSQRDVWGETLAKLVADDPKIIVLDGDLANSTKADTVALEHPDQFIEIGIAEQNMVGMAAGLTTLGYRPWLSSFAVFLTQRPLDQVRMLVSQTKAPVRLAGAYAGLLNGSSGKTHQDIEDLAVMRAMPNMTVVAPADARETELATIWASAHPGPVYMRLARDAETPVFPDDHAFEPGKPRLVRSGKEGAEAVVVSTGVQTARTLRALDALSSTGNDLPLIHVATLKPFDDEAFIQLVGAARLIITVEEHSVLGGLGGLICETVADLSDRPRVARIGLADRWSESGPNAYLLDKYGLSSERVAEQLGRVLAGHHEVTNSAAERR